VGTGRIGATRRGLVLGGVAAAVAGCGGGGGGGTGGGRARPVAAPPRRPGSRPFPNLPAGTDTMPRIDHILVLMMENHSFDNYLGALGRGDGLPLGRDGRPAAVNLDATGKPVRSFHLTTTCQLHGKPSQTWNDSHIQWNGGRNDGFARSASGPIAMGYWTAADLPFYHGLARTFPLADRYFSSVLSQTYPNRRFLMAGSAYGQVVNTLSRSDPPPPNGTIFDRLNAHQISWRNYYSAEASTLIIPSIFLENRAKVVPIDDFFTDAARGTLPGFALIDPDFLHTSEEDPQNIAAGEAFAERVIRAVMAGPAWSSTLLIWCYDEGGGYYDHVPPPRAVAPDSIRPEIHSPPDQPGGYDRYGFRVPCVVVSPYARRDYISSVVHDHTSILKLVETKWNLPALTFRDANASNLLDCLDLTGPPAFAVPPRLPAANTTAARVSCGTDRTDPF
jgi:phospholipase C